MNLKGCALITLAAVLVAAVAIWYGMAAMTVEDPLDGTSWVLLEYGLEAPLPGTQITADFAHRGVIGYSGCNTYGGTYEVKGETISVTEIYLTMMVCKDPEGIMDQELDYLECLSGVTAFRLSEGQLEMIRPSGKTLTFRPAE